MKIDYKFNEKNLINELQEYIDKTYTNGHYNKDKFQATEFIIDASNMLLAFAEWHILKYAQRYASKAMLVTPEKIY